MLTQLDDVPWAKLEHAYGPANDVPDLLRSLLDSDPKVRSNTMGTLYGNVIHQGTRFPATPYVIPFLIELCQSPEVPERGELLQLWGILIAGYFCIQERPNWADGTHVFVGSEIQEVDAGDEYADALHEIYRRSLEGRFFLYELLRDSIPGIRASAAWVLACLPTIRAESLPHLRQQLSEEESGWVRAAMAFALGELEDAATLRSLLDDEHPAARCMAACELVRIAPQEDLIDRLVPFLSEPIDGYQDVPGSGRDSTGDAAFSIVYLPFEARQKAIPAICDRLEAARSFATMPLATALLAAAFEPRREPLTTLNDLQRQVLLRMLDTQELWFIGNLSRTFSEYGLPRDQKKCAALVGVRVVDDEALSELSNAVDFAEMGFLAMARDGINKALALDPAVFARVPSPDQCWFMTAKAFAETDPERAMHAFRHAESINPTIIWRVEVTWKLAQLLEEIG